MKNCCYDACPFMKMPEDFWVSRYNKIIKDFQDTFRDAFKWEWFPEGGELYGKLTFIYKRSDTESLAIIFNLSQLPFGVRYSDTKNIPLVFSGDGRAIDFAYNFIMGEWPVKLTDEGVWVPQSVEFSEL